MLLYPYIIFFFTLFLHGEPVKNIDFSKKNFPDKKKEFKIAVRQYEKGNYFFDTRRYNEAIPFFLQANEFNPDNAELNFKIGFSYLNTENKPASVTFFKKVFALSTDAKKEFPELNYYLGLASHYNAAWSEALFFYEKYLSEISSNESDELKNVVRKKIEECRNAENITLNLFSVEPVKNINSEYDDHSCVFIADSSMLFTSRRHVKATTTDLKDQKYFESVFKSSLVNNEWKKPEVSRFSDFDQHFAVAGGSTDGKSILLFQNLNILETNYENGKWSIPRYLNLNADFSKTSGWLCPKCKMIIIVADIPGGVGGKDIYITHKNEKGKWESLTNLGKPVNTEYDEEGVFIMGDTLYFSSKGHNSCGGYDVFKSYFRNMQWTKPENLGFPINSPYDDLFYVKDMNNKYYFSSNRPGNGGFDIYTESIPEEIKEEIAEKNDSLISDTVQKEIAADTIPAKEVETVADVVKEEKKEVLSDTKNEVEVKNSSDKIESITREIKSEIAYCVVQVGAFTKISTKKQFRNKYNFDEYPVYIEKEGELNKFIIKKKFYNKGGSNLFDSNNKVLKDAAKVQMKCKEKYKIDDAFIAVYDKNNKRIALIMDVPGMRYTIFK